jgi:hypothetical protein
MRKIILIASTIICFSFIAGCDKGIEPAEATVLGQMGFTGKITFTGTWPAGIKRTHIVIFKNIIQSADDFSLPNLSFVIDSIPYRSSSYTYSSIENNNEFSILTLAPGDYNYVIVAQSKIATLSLDRKDWSVVGIYYSGNDYSKPGTMKIQNGVMTTDININVDFNNPPPQPPGG